LSHRRKSRESRPTCQTPTPERAATAPLRRRRLQKSDAPVCGQRRARATRAFSASA
jgi:hypothetical protein